MNLTYQLTNEILALFFIVFFGFILVRKQILKLEDASVLSKLVLYVCGPATIIRSFQITLTKERMEGFLLSVLFAIGIQLFFIVLMKVIAPIFHMNEVESASIIYSNSGNLIVPLVTIILGEDMVFYATGYMMVQTVLIWTHLKFMLHKEAKFNIKSIFLNINMIAIIVGLGLCFFHITLPRVVLSALNSAKAPLGPLSMLVVGMLLAHMNFKQIFLNTRIYLISIMRLFLLPLITIGLILLLRLPNLFPIAPQVIMISMLAVSGPSASTVTQFAQLYNNRPEEASLINTLTFLICMISMPTINMIYTFFIK